MSVRLLTLLAVAIITGSQAAVPSYWEWVAPQPHRQSWVDIAAGPAGFVGLTDGFGGRKIYRSVNGEQWALSAAPSTSNLRRIMFVNGNYLALGDGATIVSSADGIDWQVRHADASKGSLFDVTYGNGMYVAVGYNSVAYYSKDLKSWTPLEFSAGYSLLNVEFGNGFFLAVANIGKAYKSVDGRVWNQVEWPSAVGAGDWSSYEAGLAFNNGKFVLSMSGGTASSDDGINWTSGSPTFFRRMCAVDSGFIGITGSSLALSADGATWNTTCTLPDWKTLFYGVAKRNDCWLAVGYAGLIYRSTNGVAWEALSTEIDYSHSKIAFGNGAFVRYGEEAGVYVSNDGTDWTFNATAPDMTTLTAGNGAWVAITGDGTAAVSTDAATWNQVALPAAPYGDLIFGNGTFVVATEGGFLTSANGNSWQQITVPNVQSIRLVGFQNGIFAAMSNASEPMTSSDGKTWTVHAARPDINAQYFATGNGRFLGLGAGGMGAGGAVWSTDGVNWQSQRLETGSTYGYTGLAFGGGYFIMIDGSGGIYYSADGLTWSGDRQAAQPFTGSAYGNGVWLVVGGDSILRSILPMTAKSAATLQLTRSTFSTWNLIVTGSAGERWQIQSSATVGGAWAPVQSVQIPAAGTVTLPLPNGAPSGFFRAVVQP